MSQQDITRRYRELDAAAARFTDRQNSAREFEGSLFVPDIARKPDLEKELQSLAEQVDALERPDPVYELLQEHFAHYLQGQKAALQSQFERPGRHLGQFLNAVQYMARKDSRSVEERTDILLSKLRQAPAVWQGVETLLPQVPPLYLQELIGSAQSLVTNLPKEQVRLAEDFAGLSETVLTELRSEIEKLTAAAGEWGQTAAAHRVGGAATAKPSSDDDIIKFEEDYYRALLHDVLGVELDELLKWHEDEIEKTRAAVFEIGSRLKMTDPAPLTMQEVSDILNKYAGPAATPEEMFARGREYLKRAQAGCRDYVWLPDDESCRLVPVYEQLKDSYPWGGYGGGCPLRRPLMGEMFLNNYNFQNITDGWIKMNAIHESYPGHHVQFIRMTLDPLPETVKKGTRLVPLSEGTCHRSEKVFEFVFEEDQFYPLFVAYRRHHTAVRIKAELFLRYFGRPIGDAVKLYMDELGFDYTTARGQVRAQETQLGYFNCYYYGFKKLNDLEKQHGIDVRKYTEMLFAAGRVSLETFEKYLKLSEEQRQCYLNDFASLIQFPDR